MFLELKARHIHTNIDNSGLDNIELSTIFISML